MRCITRQDGRLIAKTKALNLSSLASKVTGIGRRNLFFVAIAKPILNLSAVFVKEHGLSFLAAETVNIFEDMISFPCLTDNSLQT